LLPLLLPFKLSPVALLSLVPFEELKGIIRTHQDQKSLLSYSSVLCLRRMKGMKGMELEQFLFMPFQSSKYAA
jgi:hypothetical protein